MEEIESYTYEEALIRSNSQKNYNMVYPEKVQRYDRKGQSQQRQCRERAKLTRSERYK